MFLNEQERAETIWACRFCPMCNVADRAAQILRRESYTPRGRAAVLFALDRGLLSWDSGVADIMYTALNDGLLREWCVGNYDHEELVIDARAKLFREGLAPAEVQIFLSRLPQDSDSAPSPSDILSQEGLSPGEQAQSLLFAGRVVRSTRPQALVSLARLFESAGEPYAVLEREPLSGWEYYQLGDWDSARSASHDLSQALSQSGAGQVVVLDSEIYRMLVTRTARFGGDLKGLKVRHYSTLLAGWLAEGRLKVKQPPDRALTYHDPSALARYSPELEAPRQVIARVNRAPLREMAFSGALAGSVGYEGCLEVLRPDLAAEIARRRLAEAGHTGAELLVTACPRAAEALARAAGPDDPRPLDLVELLEQAINN